MLKTVAQLGAAHGRSGDPALRQAGRVTAQSMRLREQLQPFASREGDEPGHLSQVGRRVPDAACARWRRCSAPACRSAASRCARRAATTRTPTSRRSSRTALKLTSDSLLAFQRDLEARGLADRVLVHVWTEFGRRAKENGSNGTDHGAAGVGFLLGTQTTGTMVGEFPGLTGGLDEDGNLKATADFRGVYAALSEQWLGVDADAIIPNASRSPSRNSSNEGLVPEGGCPRAWPSPRPWSLLRRLRAAGCATPPESRSWRRSSSSCRPATY